MPPPPAARLALAASLLLAPSLPALAQQTPGDLGAELDAIRDELRGELAEARQQVRETAREIQGGLNTTEPVSPGDRVDRLHARVASLERALARARQAQAMGERERQQADARNERLAARSERLKTQNEHLQAQNARLQAQNAALQAKLPAAQGGNLDLEKARRSAAESTDALVAAYHRNASPGDIAALADRLFRDQARLARGLDATVYRVGNGETLGGIAARHFGNFGRWPAILEANRHVITDPDRLWPAMTLVLPMP